MEVLQFREVETEQFQATKTKRNKENVITGSEFYFVKSLPSSPPLFYSKMASPINCDCFLCPESCTLFYLWRTRRPQTGCETVVPQLKVVSYHAIACGLLPTSTGVHLNGLKWLRTHKSFSAWILTFLGGQKEYKQDICDRREPVFIVFYIKVRRSERKYEEKTTTFLHCLRTNYL